MDRFAFSAFILGFLAVGAWAEDATRPVKVVVQPEDTDVSLEGIELNFRWTDHRESVETDENGEAVVDVPDPLPKYFQVRMTPPKDHVYVSATWRWNDEDDVRALPDVIELPLGKGETVSGKVTGEDGEPVEGAKVYLLVHGLDDSEPIHRSIDSNTPVATTDEDGAWTFNAVPSDVPEFWLNVRHDDFVSDDVWDSGYSFAQLKSGDIVTVLPEGFKIAGRIVDEDGEPLRSVVVKAGRWSDDNETRTDSDGRFELRNMSDERVMLTVQKRKYAPLTQWVQASKVDDTIEFVLERGREIRVQVIDENGDPIEDASVRYGADNSIQEMDLVGAKKSTDEEGRWEWESAGADPVPLQIQKEGLIMAEPALADPDGEELKVVLRPPLTVTGAAVDAETGEPIPGATIFETNIWSSGGHFVDRSESIAKEDGAFDREFSRTDCDYALYAMAPGYESYISEPFGVRDSKSLRIELPMKKAAPLTGRVVDPDGAPMADAQVVLCTPSQQINISSGKLSDWPKPISAQTNEDGVFEMAQPGEEYLLVVVDDRGYAEIHQRDFEKTQELRAQEWARVEGIFAPDGEPISGETVTMSPIRYRAWDGPLVSEWTQTRTAEDGSFVFERVSPRPQSVGVRIGPWEQARITAGPNVPIDPKPGETLKLELGGYGKAVVGRLAIADGNDTKLDWNWGLNYLVRKKQGVRVPDEIADHDFSYEKGWQEAWQSSTEGGLYFSTLERHFVKVQPDGTFRIPDVKPDDYILSFRLYDFPEESCLTSPLCTRNIEFTVSDNVEEIEVDLGTIIVDPMPPLMIGESAPGFEVEPVTGATPIRLEDFAGKYVLLDIWATWCGPCRKEMPTLKMLNDTYGNDLAIVSLSLDSDIETAKRFVKENNLDWVHGYLGEWANTDLTQRYNVSNIPAIFLIDPEGKLVDRFLRGPAMIKAVEEALGE